MTLSEARRRERFERLFRDTRIPILGYLLRRSGSPEDAADALADIYLIAWTRLEVIPEGDQARLWLFGVARNVLKKGVSRDHSHQALVERLAGELRISSAPPSVADDEDADRLRTALSGLREIDREILTLIAWDGLTPAEVAHVLGLSANTIRVRLHRARTRLQQELLREIPPEGRRGYMAIRGGVRVAGDRHRLADDDDPRVSIRCRARPRVG